MYTRDQFLTDLRQRKAKLTQFQENLVYELAGKFFDDKPNLREPDDEHAEEPYYSFLRDSYVPIPIG